jgi:hypothetical protein
MGISGYFGSMARAILVGLVLIIGAVIGAIGATFYMRSTMPQPARPVWQIVAQPGNGYHAWRLHTVTGEVDFCAIEANERSCLPVDVWTVGQGGKP